MSEQIENRLTDLPETSAKRSWLYRFFVFVYHLGVWIFFLFFLWAVILKWLPVPFTPTIMQRSLSAYFRGEDGRVYYQWVSYHKMASSAKLAVVASEDQRFPTHCGLDFRAIAQALEENKTRNRPRGASTISQQVAKNVFLWQGGGYLRKALEVPLTYMIEVLWGKERILEVYLNIAEMGPQTFGIQAAAKRFFRKNAQQLSPAEAATLAAILPNPRVYQTSSPYAQYRSHQIMYQMQLLGGLSYLQDMSFFQLPPTP